MPATADEAEQHISKSSDLIQGTLEMLILKTLALEPMHGYGVALRIEQISNGVFRVNPGSLFPALARLEHAARQALPPHRPRPKSPQGRDPAMGPPARRHHQHPRSLKENPCRFCKTSP